MSEVYPFQFTGEIVTYDVGSERYVYTVVFVPEALHDELPLAQTPGGRLRVTGEIDEQPYSGALMPVPGEVVPGSRGPRRYYLLLSKKLLRAMHAGLGDSVRVRLALDDPAAVDVPVDLAAALKKNAAMRKRWDALTPGKQRGLAYRVASAKRSETRQRRILEVFEIMTGERDARGRRVR